MSSLERETDLMEVENKTEENRKVTFNPCYRHFYNACFDVHRDVNSTQFILEQFLAHLIYWWCAWLRQVKVERKKLRRAAQRAEKENKKRGLQAVRDRQNIPDDIGNNIREEGNFHLSLPSLSVTEEELMDVKTAADGKRKVSFTHAIDIFVERASTSMEMSIIHNIFFNNFRLI